jgi:FkbM family methyltransferase
MTLGKFAAGAHESTEMLHVANDTQSSSILAMKTHKEEYPEIDYIKDIQIEVKDIDSWLEANGIEARLYNFLNLDVQGYELMALKGCKVQLDYVDLVYTEVNREELYENCVTVEILDRHLKARGFKRVATVMTRHGWGDALYAKKPYPTLMMKILAKQKIDWFVAKIKRLWKRLKCFRIKAASA